MVIREFFDKIVESGSDSHHRSNQRSPGTPMIVLVQPMPHRDAHQNRDRQTQPGTDVTHDVGARGGRRRIDHELYENNGETRDNNKISLAISKFSIIL